MFSAVISKPAVLYATSTLYIPVGHVCACTLWYKHDLLAGQMLSEALKPHSVCLHYIF